MVTEYIRTPATKAGDLWFDVMIDFDDQVDPAERAETIRQYEIALREALDGPQVLPPIDE